MKTLTRFLLFAVVATALSAEAAYAQTRPVAKPVAKPAAKLAPKPVAKPAPRSVPAPAASPNPAPSPARAAAAPGGTFDVGTSVVNLGLGLGTHYTYGIGTGTSVSPAFSASFERGLVAVGPGIVGVGLFAGYQSASYEYLGYKDKFTDIIITARAAFHYPLLDKLDTYGGAGLGLRRVGFSPGFSGPTTVDYGSTGMVLGLFVGGRYYFTDSIGAFAELGYDQTFLKVGLAVKF